LLINNDLTILVNEWQIVILIQYNLTIKKKINPTTTSNNILISTMKTRLSFLSIVIIILSIIALAWIVYYIRKYRRRRVNDNPNRPPPSSPTDLWFTALLHYPRVFLVLSILLPLSLSLVGFARSGYKINVNLDFESYLEIQTDLDSVAENYAKAQAYEYQQELSLSNTTNNGEANLCERKRRVQEKESQLPIQIEELELPPEEAFSFPEEQDQRKLLYDGAVSFASNGQFLSLIYQNRNGGSVFTPEVLTSIRDFEQSILDFPGFRDICFAFGSGRCLPFDSLTPAFFQEDEGRVLDQAHIDSVLRSFLGQPQNLWKMDQYFGPNNLSSNITLTFVYLRDVGGDQSAANPFLEELYRELLWKGDQEHLYPDMVYTWSNPHLEEIEAMDALTHDTFWSFASLGFIGLMILLKVQNGFVFLFSMLGLLLSFSTALYWCSAHFAIQEITLLHVSGLFVMLGIGADDIFLMVDSFDHKKLMEYDVDADGEDNIRQRMKAAYSQAGSMMLVSSLTTSVCFFSNAFGVLVVIQEFGIYMGMVVLVNYVHVMTILPSAILVNELYFSPWTKKCWKKMNNAYFREQQQTAEAGRMVGEDYSIEKHQETLIASSENGTSDAEEGLTTTEQTEGVDLQVNENSTENQDTQSVCSHDDRFDSEVGWSAKQAEDRGREEESSITKPGTRSVCSISETDSFDAETGLPAPSIKNAMVEEQQGTHDDFLENTSRMNRMDRWLVGAYAPFITKRRFFVVFLSVFLASIMGTFGVINFTVSDGTIVIFTEKYNLGRLTVISDAYYNSQLTATIEKQPNNERTPPTFSPLTPAPPAPPASPSPTAPPAPPHPTAPTAPTASTAPTAPIDPTAPPVPTAPTASTPAPAFVAQIPVPTGAPTSSDSSGVGQVPTVTQTPTSGGNIGAPASSNSSGVGQVPTVTQTPTSAGNIGAPTSSNSNGVGQIPTMTQTPTSAGNIGAPTGPNSAGDRLPTATGPTANTNTNTSPTTASCTQTSCQNGGSCFDGRCRCSKAWTGPACTLPDETLKRRETISVSLIWGVEPTNNAFNLWVTKNRSPPEASSPNSNVTILTGLRNNFDPSEPHVQEWLLEVIKLAREESGLTVQPDRLTWIEILRDFAIEEGVGFPIPQNLFVEFLQLLKSMSCDFANLVSKDIGTRSPGLTGEFLFASLTVYADVLETETSLSMTAYKRWSHFAKSVNRLSPPNVPPVVAYSKVFEDAYRSEETIDSTVTTWAVANGLCLAIILIFTQNVLLSLMVMVTITLIFLCLVGLLFAVFTLSFGPVEALGVSIFIGLSANYSLHVVHAYHRSQSALRENKVKQAFFLTGSPIFASALSTIGGGAFLFCCRTYAFVQLGILICSITSMALLFSMAFLLAWLAMIGPLPSASDADDDQHLHQWDLKVLCCFCWRKLNVRMTDDDDEEKEKEKEDDPRSEQ
jgi:predicted RND superfamily exporter protein